MNSYCDIFPECAEISLSKIEIFAIFCISNVNAAVITSLVALLKSLVWECLQCFMLYVFCMTCWYYFLELIPKINVLYSNSCVLPFVCNSTRTVTYKT